MPAVVVSVVELTWDRTYFVIFLGLGLIIPYLFNLFVKFAEISLSVIANYFKFLSDILLKHQKNQWWEWTIVLHTCSSCAGDGIVREKMGARLS